MVDELRLHCAGSQHIELPGVCKVKFTAKLAAPGNPGTPGISEDSETQPAHSVRQTIMKAAAAKDQPQLQSAHLGAETVYSCGWTPASPELCQEELG